MFNVWLRPKAAPINPRTQAWEDYFSWDEAALRNKTPVGAATVELLRINQPERVDHRRLLMRVGMWQ
jgi:hypothetical protein